MKKDSKYPKWFHASFNYYDMLPKAPSKTINEYEEVERIKVDRWGGISPFTPPKADHIYAEVETDPYDDTIYGITLIFSNKKEVPNPNYDKEYKYYQEQVKVCRDKKKEWKIYKKMWDEDQEKQKLKRKSRS